MSSCTGIKSGNPLNSWRRRGYHGCVFHSGATNTILTALHWIFASVAHGVHGVFARFSSCKYGSRLLQNEIHISWQLQGLLRCFFSYELAENTTRKASFKVCEELLCPVFDSKKKLICV